MTRLEDIKPQSLLRGIISGKVATVVNTTWHGTEVIELTYKTDDGKLSNLLLYRSDENRIVIEAVGRHWSFDGDGYLFSLASEAQRIHLAHLFDPLLAIHTSVIDPLPHQITAVYEDMLPRQPLRFLLADDPGAGKTIMSGLLIKELMVRGDLQRCLIVCPGPLGEQWQNELASKFQLPFDILTNDKIEASRSGNYFAENSLVIARLDKLSRSEDAQAMLTAPGLSWDLVIFDEAHKLSATVFGNEVKYTKRYHLGQLLSSTTRNLLLLTATPHNGKDQDFQLFMALLDGDRFEGGHRDGARSVDVSDLMRRAVKEQLLKFDGTPLFPERIAHTVPYRLSNEEAALYSAVTNYVREEFNRVDALANGKRAGTVGFALTILQRRLASSPEAIYQSLRRRRERLESRYREFEILERGSKALDQLDLVSSFDVEELDDLEDAADTEFEDDTTQVIDQATAARSLAELRIEIETLKKLESLANKVRLGGLDSKWRELSSLLGEVFTALPNLVEKAASTSPKLGIFTEHRDTLRYLIERITSYLGRSDAVVSIHGGIGRQERQKLQEAFSFDPNVKVLVATDAAGEGINLQRAHLMVNYDLPWNPNRLEQRFGRIHRIGQQEVCYLWNLVASETREGDVYQLLLNKLNEARTALGGQVFDVLGKLNFEGKPLRDLLLEAIRYSELPEVKARLDTVVSDALDVEHLRELLGERAIVSESMDVTSVFRVKEDLERAEARRLQPGFVKMFFLSAFSHLGGRLFERESNRYEVTFVPAVIRNRDRQIGIREPVLNRYERVVFDKSLIAPHSVPQAAFLAPGHPLLGAVIDLVLEQNQDLLRRGATLVDDSDYGTTPRVLFYLSHSIRDGTTNIDGSSRVISKRMLYVELGSDLEARHIAYAPYLDYRPLKDDEPNTDEILKLKECSWIGPDIESLAMNYAIQHVVPEHLDDVRTIKIPLIEKTKAAVNDRLTKEFNYWYFRADQLDEDERRGKPNAKLNSNEARRRADDLFARRAQRIEQLDLECDIAPLPPLILGAALVVPRGLIEASSGHVTNFNTTTSVDRLEIAARARSIVMARERSFGFEPVDREFERVGYDIESKMPGTGDLRFIEVKGRIADSETITVTKNEILFSLNNPDRYILGIVEFYPDGSHRDTYLLRPFRSEPDFAAESVNYSLGELIAAGVSDEPTCN